MTGQTLKLTLVVLALMGCQGETESTVVDMRAGDAHVVDMSADAAVREPPIELDYVRIMGGDFIMGSERFIDAQPLHRVSVASFNMMRHEVTLAEYRTCQASGACRPFTGEELELCGFDEDVDDAEPVRCLFRSDAETFAEWAHARLPSEAEWEYAASSRGTRRPYPWGEGPPSCQLAVIGDDGQHHGPTPVEDGCGRYRPWPVCSKPMGNTEQGLCDMSGNVTEWVADRYCPYGADDRDSTPVSNCTSELGLTRGGDFFSPAAHLDVAARLQRTTPGPGTCHYCGLRLVRDLE